MHFLQLFIYFVPLGVDAFACSMVGRQSVTKLHPQFFLYYMVSVRSYACVYEQYLCVCSSTCTWLKTALYCDHEKSFFVIEKLSVHFQFKYALRTTLV